MVNEHELQTRVVQALAKVSRSAELSTQSLNSIAESLKAVARQGAGVRTDTDRLREYKTDLCSMLGMDAAEEWSTVIEEVGLYVRHEREAQVKLKEIREIAQRPLDLISGVDTATYEAIREIRDVLNRRSGVEG